MGYCNPANASRDNSNMLQKSSTCTLFVVAASVVAAGNLGCQHQQAAERRAQMRRDNVAYVVDSVERSEASRPARMHGTIGAFERLILHGKPENIEPTAIILFW